MEVSDIKIALLLNSLRKNEYKQMPVLAYGLDSFMRWLHLEICDGLLTGKYWSGIEIWWFKILKSNSKGEWLLWVSKVVVHSKGHSISIILSWWPWSVQYKTCCSMLYYVQLINQIVMKRVPNSSTVSNCKTWYLYAVFFKLDEQLCRFLFRKPNSLWVLLQMLFIWGIQDIPWCRVTSR